MMQKLITAFVLIVSLAMFAACGGGKDKDKNAAADSTKVKVNTGPGSTLKYDSGKRYIFLTWDDAPQPPGTVVCKNLFKAQGVKATFFMVGMHQFDRIRKNIVDSLRNGYPEFLIANHSYTHGFRNNYKSFYSKPDSAVKDFLQAQAELNIPLKIIRLPGNNSWVGKGEMKGPKSTMAVCKKLDSLGFNVIGWDIEWRFKGNSAPVQGADEMVREVNTKFDNYTSNEENAVVILAHDRMFASAAAQDSLNKFINVLKQDPRNVFETIDHYPMVQRK